MSSPILIRDRPVAFGTAVVLVPIGFLLVSLSFVFVANPRGAEAAFVARLLGFGMLLIGAGLAWYGRRVRLEGKQLYRGATAERSLASAGVLCLVSTEFLPTKPDVFLALGDTDAGRKLVAALLEKRPDAPEQLMVARFNGKSHVVRLAWGLPPTVTDALAADAAGQLGVPILRIHARAWAE
ncbi:MAG: hypothetical protein P1V81_05365 [Planctomycetota bacterium]|nr:hypothetical protein [Planctomycetota bacterium]